MIENFPTLMKDINLYIQNLSKPKQDKYKDKHFLPFIPKVLLNAIWQEKEIYDTKIGREDVK